MDRDPLIPKHGGYRKLKTFQIAELINDLTVRFCDRYIERRSRTHDQMVQAARSGMQNIAEGSQASGTSKKMELKLTNVARASLEELRVDYLSFLRQRGLPQLQPEHPALKRFKAKRCSTLEQVRAWVEEEREQHRQGHTDAHGLTQTNTDQPDHRPAPTEKDGQTQTNTDRPNQKRAGRTKDSGHQSVPVRVSPCASVSSATLAANAALSLLNLCCFLLDRQLAAQSFSFENEGGFTERLYHRRQSRRHPGSAPSPGRE